MRSLTWLLLPFAVLAILGPAHLALGFALLLLGALIGAAITLARRAARRSR